MKVTLGTGPDSWGVWFPSDEKQIPWSRYLDEVVAAGYTLTECGPYGYFPTDTATLRENLDRRGLKMEAGVTFGNMTREDNWPVLERETLGAGRLASSLGAKHHVLIDLPYSDLFTGEPLAPSELDEPSWKCLIKTVTRLSRLVRDEFGLIGVFHPHAETHVEYENQIERLLDETDPNVVSLCFDTGHHAYRGGDPVAFMRKHFRRIPYLHLKSVDAKVQARVQREKIPFAIAVGMDMFCEPNQGVVDFPAFVEVLREVNYVGVGIVEQDMYPAPFDKPLPIAKRTCQYLRSVGLG